MVLYQRFNAGLSSWQFGHSNSDYRHVDLGEWNFMLLSHPCHHGHFVQEPMVLVKDTDWYSHKWSYLLDCWNSSHCEGHILVDICMGYKYFYAFYPFHEVGILTSSCDVFIISLLIRFLPWPWPVLPHLCCSWITSRMSLQVNFLAVTECSSFLTNIWPEHLFLCKHKFRFKKKRENIT
jgi:hypothetical protein